MIVALFFMIASLTGLAFADERGGARVSAPTGRTAINVNPGRSLHSAGTVRSFDRSPQINRGERSIVFPDSGRNERTIRESPTGRVERLPTITNRSDRRYDFSSNFDSGRRSVNDDWRRDTWTDRSRSSSVFPTVRRSNDYYPEGKVKVESYQVERERKTSRYDDKKINPRYDRDTRSKSVTYSRRDRPSYPSSSWSSKRYDYPTGKVDRYTDRYRKYPYIYDYDRYKKRLSHSRDYYHSYYGYYPITYYYPSYYSYYYRYPYSERYGYYPSYKRYTYWRYPAWWDWTSWGLNLSYYDDDGWGINFSWHDW